MIFWFGEQSTGITRELQLNLPKAKATVELGNGMDISKKKLFDLPSFSNVRLHSTLSPLDNTMKPSGTFMLACHVDMATGGSWQGIIDLLFIYAQGVKVQGFPS